MKIERLIANKLFFSLHQNNDPIHVITIGDERRREKPPDYDQVTSMPPSYDEALKLDPSALMSQHSGLFLPSQSVSGATNTAFSMTSETSSSSRPSSSTYPSNIIIGKFRTSSAVKDEKKNEPPPYTIAPS